MICSVEVLASDVKHAEHRSQTCRVDTKHVLEAALFPRPHPSDIEGLCFID